MVLLLTLYLKHLDIMKSYRLNDQSGFISVINAPLNMIRIWMQWGVVSEKMYLDKGVASTEKLQSQQSAGILVTYNAKKVSNEMRGRDCKLYLY